MAGGNTPEIWTKRHITLSRIHSDLLHEISGKTELLYEAISLTLDAENYSDDNPLNLTTIPEKKPTDERFIYISKYKKEKALAGARLLQGNHNPYILVYFNDGEAMADDELAAVDKYDWIDVDDLNQWAYLPVLNVIAEKIKTYIKENKAKGYEKILD